MEVQTIVENEKATLKLKGKLTVQTSPDLSDAVDRLPKAVRDIDLDMAGTTYVASAGLRVLVAIDKLAAARNGTMRVLQPSNDVLDVLEMTGLADVFTIEQ